MASPNREVFFSNATQTTIVRMTATQRNAKHCDMQLSIVKKLVITLIILLFQNRRNRFRLLSHHYAASFEMIFDY